MAGYSKTPLINKLGIKPDHAIFVLNAPVDYWNTLGALPESAVVHSDIKNVQFDFIHLFYKEIEELETDIPKFKSALKKNGMLWVSWPKKSSKVATTLSDSLVRNIGLHTGLVDTKKCAIDDVWSGLKFVFRLKDR